MTRYATEPENPAKSVKARGANLRVHYKNTREAAGAIRNMPLKRATRFLKNVIDLKEIVPFRSAAESRCCILKPRLLVGHINLM